MIFYGHSANRGDEWEPLAVHLKAVAERAMQFAATFGIGEQAYFAGLLHDLGKYSQRFVGRLNGTEKRGLDHWSLGAMACAMASKRFGQAAALAVEGHHVGLGKLQESTDEVIATIRKRMDADIEFFTETNPQSALDRLIEDQIVPRLPKSGFSICSQSDLSAAEMLDIRMLFSALVDADFLETEAHFQGDRATPRRPRDDGPEFRIETALAALEKRISRIREKASTGPMQSLRDRLLADCVAMGQSAPTGAFTLAAPTGAGKTLAMLAFALYHARKHDLRRIVLAMPFLNIVDQTAQVYEGIFTPSDGFDENFVLEQHSLVEDIGEPGIGDATAGRDRFRRQLSENWDAPIILTTTVQLLESLHARKPSRCRKLHRLAKSVILLDEVQTLPPKLASLTLSTLSRLAQADGPYQSSVVFATATQPAFESLGDRVKQYHRIGWNPDEIVSDAPSLFAQASNRVKIQWRDDVPIAIESLAAELAQCPRVLAIVNLKRHAAKLTEELQSLAPEGLFYLSTNLCPVHRRKVLDTIRVRLADPSSPPTRLIATQCVEAGVDLDFRPIDGSPVLYRALSPLDSIAQAAGRANRNGVSSTAKMVVFQLADDGRGLTYPPGYREGVGATAYVLSSYRKGGVDLNSIDLINDPEVIQKYYLSLYALNGRNEGPAADEQDLNLAIVEGDFAKVAEAYRLIENNAINIVVSYDRKVFKELRQQFKANSEMSPKFVRAWQRRARLHSVAIFRPKPSAAIWSHLDPIVFGNEDIGETATATWFWPLAAVTYDNQLGLQIPDESVWIG